jgi:hypothetical protein
MVEYSRTTKKHCKWCNKEFVTRRLRQKYCCDECRYNYFHDTHLYVTSEVWAEYQRLKRLCLHAESNEPAAPQDFNAQAQ